MNIKIKLLTYGSSLILAAGISNMAHAQSANIEEIVVTARKVSESLQEVPVAISALNGAMLEERGLEDLTEIARNVPGFTFENYNGAFAVPVIRGQSQSSLIAPIQNVSTFYNGVYLQRGYMLDANLINVGQVDVLRGPQSAALGRSAYAGAVSFTSKTAGDEFTAYGAISAGENDYLRYDVTAELPIFGDKLGLIAGYSHDEFDGGWENNHALADVGGPEARTKGNLGGYEYDTFNIGVNFAPNDRFYVKANYLNNERDVENNAQYVMSGTANFGGATLNCGAASPFTGNNALFCGELPTTPALAAGEQRSAGLVIDPRAGLSTESEIFTLEGSFDLTENVNVNVLYGNTSADFDGAGSSSRNPELGLGGFLASLTGPINVVDTSGNGSIESNSLEGRITWTPSDNLTTYIGAFTSDSDDLSKNTLFNAVPQTTGELSPLVPLGPPFFSANDSLNNRGIQSVFGFVEYKTGDVSLSAEGRFTNEDVTESNNIAGTSATEKFDYFTPRLTGNYFYADDKSVYVSYAKGVKAGGFNTGGSAPATFADPTEATYDTETNNTFEIGSRNKFLDGDLTLNATAYYIDAKDLQINSPKTGANGSVLRNLASAETLGFEIETNYNLSDALNIYGSVGYNDASYGDNVIDSSNASRCDDVVCNTSGDISGNRLARTPRLTLNGGFGWETALTSDMDYYIRGSASHQDKAYSNTINTAFFPSRTIVDTSVGIKTNGFEAKLAIDNLFDEKYVGSAFEVGFLQTYVLNLGNRRRVSGTLSYRFD